MEATCSQSIQFYAYTLGLIAGVIVGILLTAISRALDAQEKHDAD